MNVKMDGGGRLPCSLRKRQTRLDADGDLIRDFRCGRDLAAFRIRVAG